MEWYWRVTVLGKVVGSDRMEVMWDGQLLNDLLLTVYSHPPGEKSLLGMQ